MNQYGIKLELEIYDGLKINLCCDSGMQNGTRW